MTIEQKHLIDIPGLPEGYRAVAYRRPVFGEYYFYNDGIQQGRTGSGQFLIVEKIKPRRIVLEETGEDTDPLLYQPIKIDGLCVLMVMHNKIWRVVEEE